MLSFDDIIHTYELDGTQIPSVTTLLTEIKFANKYTSIPERVLEKAAQRGTDVHKDIENYCLFGIESERVELKNFKFLQRQYKFEVLENELMTYYIGDVSYAGTIDLVLSFENEIALADIKTTSVLDKEYLAYQLNLYKLAYEQRTGNKVTKLFGIHLRSDKRKLVPIPINERYTYEILNKYKEIKHE